MKLSLNILLFLLLLSCTKKENDFSVKALNQIIIEDEEPYIGELYNLEFKSKSHFFTYDNRANIKEFRDYAFTNVQGKIGKGPCEHGSINNFTAFRDTLFMLDREQGKYLKYDTSNNSIDNCKEIFDETVVRLSGIQVFENKTFFVRSSLVRSLTLDTPIIYRFDENKNKIIASDIVLGDLDISLSGVPMRLSMASDKLGKKLLFYLPLTQKIFIYDTVNKSLKDLVTDIYIAEDQNIYQEKNLRKFSTLLNNEIEIVFDLFAVEKSVALGYRKGTGENQVWGLKIFDYAGNKIAEKKFENRVIYMDEEELMTLNLDTEKQQNPYSFKVYEYAFE